MKALALLSGGLDSILAAVLVKEQGIDVEGVNFYTGFCTCGESGVCKEAATSQLAYALNIKLHQINNAEDRLNEVVLKPKHGYGSEMNPCIDCRIFMLRRAKTLMTKIGAQFLITGEVLNQRPMSQYYNTLRLIEKEAGVEGILLRPLSAKFLPMSVPEKMKWVNRDSFPSIRGRSRKPQLALAKERNITGYSTPAGGCLLSDKAFAKRLRDLIKHHKNNINMKDIELLKIGRHFRFDEYTKLVVGRNEKENKKLVSLKSSDDFMLEAKEFVGPISLLRGRTKENHLNLAAAITARYSDAPKESSVKIKYTNGYIKTTKALKTYEEDIKRFRI